MSTLRADALVAAMAAELRDGDVVATGVASSLAVLAIAVARATHAPRLTYLACVGAVEPEVQRIHASSEDLAYLGGRRGELSIPDLFDHARRGRIDTIFFGAAEVDAAGRSNMSATGSLERPVVKLPGVAGAAALRRWVRRPVLVMPRQTRRNLVNRVQVASTVDARPTPLLTDLGRFEVGGAGAVLRSHRPWTTVAEVTERTGFAFTVAEDVATDAAPAEATLEAIRALDPDNLRERLVG
ncbi:MAG TPA: CoA-transferase [Myxococcaceae bacterium]|jgi:glutaconate CoA-transferase subunit B|nr:CoA-transferase [Myxococcaceae bacterium]